MRVRAVAVLCLGLLSTGADAASLTPLANGDRILWIGNSYSEWFGATPDALKALLVSASPAVNIETRFIVKGMGILKEYYTYPNLAAVETIRQGNWKYVVIQTWEDAIKLKDTDVEGYPECQDTLIKYAGLFYQEVRNINSVMILFDGHPGTWSYPRDIARMREAYARIKTALPDVITLATSESWDSLRALYPTQNYQCPPNHTFDGTFITLLYHDCGHQNGNGKALDAYTFYSFLTGKSGRGLTPQWPIEMYQDQGELWSPQLFPTFADIAYAEAMKQRGGVTVVSPMATRAVRQMAPARGAQAVTALNGRVINSGTPRAPALIAAPRSAGASH